MLHETMNDCSSVPPHRSPPKFEIDWPAWGGRNDVPLGNVFWVTPGMLSMLAVVVTVLNVEPGG